MCFEQLHLCMLTFIPLLTRFADASLPGNAIEGGLLLPNRICCLRGLVSELEGCTVAWSMGCGPCSLSLV